MPDRPRPGRPRPRPAERLAQEAEPAADATAGAVEAAPTEKLHKVLARAGIASRRACEDLIRAGRVQVNGRRASVEDRVDAEHDHITVDRRPIPRRPAAIYVMLHKPRGYVTTARDPQGRKTVHDLVDLPHRLFAVGRLDFDSSGLLLMTNDGEFSQRLLHPRYHVPRIYVVRVRGDVPPTVLGRLRHGVPLEDGVTEPARVEAIERGFNTTILRMTLREGRQRQIRRMCEAVGHPVLDLHRVGLGPLRLGDLGAGRWRHLKAAEVAALLEAAVERPRAKRRRETAVESPSAKRPRTPTRRDRLAE